MRLGLKGGKRLARVSKRWRAEMVAVTQALAGRGWLAWQEVKGGRGGACVGMN